MAGSNVADQTRLLRVEIYLKLYMLALVLVGYFVLNKILQDLRFPVERLGATLFLFLVVNIIYLYLLKKTVRLYPLYALVGATDILFFTMVIHFFGGVDSPVLAILYLLPVPFFSILISPSAGYLMVIASSISLALLYWAEYQNIVGYYGNHPILLERIGIILFFMLFCFISFAFYIGYFSDVLRRHQKALSEANREIEKHNATLEERIARRTRELEEAQGKLREHSQQLERAYTEKSMQLEVIQRRLETSLGELKLKYNYENIIGSSLRMQDVFRLMDKVTDFNVSILIQGESGTGKELVAKAIHYNGPRKDKPFVIQNCSAMTDTLLESELFGHVKGSFTGAYQDRKGLFEEADQGTLFLDEIGDMSQAMQAKLLRALQEGEIRPVGGKRVINVDVRIISATNKDLKGAVGQGRFREDLFYRLNGVTIQLPPLRERREDIALLADYFLRSFCGESGIGRKALSQEVQKILFAYAWPGNVRELENTIKHACVISQGETINPEDFRYKPELFEGIGRNGEGMQGVNGGSISSGRADETDQIGSRNVEGLDRVVAGVRPIKSLKQTERDTIENALSACGGRRRDAARVLNIPVRTLYEKIKRYGIE